MDTARLQTIYEEVGKPGARVFRTAARKKGQNITQAEAQEFVKKQAQGQVFASRLPSDGKVTASRADMRFQVDLLDINILSFPFIDMNNHYDDFQTYQGFRAATLLHCHK